MRAVFAIALVAGTCAAAGAQTVSFMEISRVKLDQTQFTTFNGQPNPAFIGGNPSAVAWKNGRLFVGGFRNAGFSGTDTAIVEVTNPMSLGGQGTYGNRFGVVPMGALAGRGYSGLQLVSDGAGNDKLAAAYDLNEAPANNYIGEFSVGANTGDAASALWSANERGGSGVAYDNNGDVLNPVLASNFLRKRAAGTGTGIWTSNFGANGGPTIGVLNGSPTATPNNNNLFRDIDVDSNGMLWLRERNGVYRMDPNGFVAPLAAPPAVPNIPFTRLQAGTSTNAGQNIAVLEGALGGELVIWNDRSNAGTGQTYGLNMRLATTDASAANRTLSLVHTLGSKAAGVGWFDFAWDSGTQTLAIVDFANREVSIYQLPTPGAAALLGLGGLLASRRRRA